MNDSLRQAIFETITFFDVLDHPLTALEVQLYLRAPQGATLSDILNGLRELPGVEQTSGMWHRAGRSDLVARRTRTYTLVHDKLSRAHRALTLITKLPTVEAAYICNNLGFFAGHDESDIDLFIIARPKTLWITRLMTLFIAEMTGLRIHGGNAANKLCLSFFLSGDALDIGWLQKEQDIYLQFWMHGLLPLTEQSRTHPFLEVNQWMRPYAGGSVPKVMSARRTYRGGSAVGVTLARVLEPFAKRLQLALMSRETLEAAVVNSTDVVVNDQMLKFHDHDRRAEYAAAFYQRLASL